MVEAVTMLYVFGAYTLDMQCYELRRAEELIPLGPQVFNVLAYLVAHRDRVVSRDELFARLWPEQFVTDDALGRCIRAARRALEDRPEAPRYITTTRGRGYRFIAPVREEAHAPPEDGASTTVLAHSSPQSPSAAGCEGLSLPVSVPTVSGELQRPSEEFRPPSLAGEYKQVTVLCGGLADAVALAGRLGPEAMHRRMQAVFTIAQQVLHRYAGSLLEFGGEGFVALFGAPIAQEDHAQRAVLAALALHAQVAASAPDLGQASVEPLVLCLGLHTGRVVVDRLGGDPRRLYTAAGETTQVALQLRQLAAPGTTLLSAATQHLVRENVQAEPRGEVQVGAAPPPVPVYAVQGITRQRSGVVGHGARMRSPFVGRARELALLQERLDAVVAGQGQAVAVVGDPGMGKSRLLAEFRRGLAGREAWYVEGHCLSYGSATPYLPVVDLVRQLCGRTASEPRAAITAIVHRRLREADLDPDEGVPLILSLLAIPFETERLAQLSPPERKARTFALLRHLVFHEAQRHPCILTVENLHWSDATSEEWLTSLVQRLAGAALLVLVTYRPGYQPPWLAQSYATQIALSPLRAGDSRTVVQAVLQTASAPETVVQEIVTQAAGNPFFLEELAWNVVERGGLPAPLEVPETIEAVLAARIDRLPPEEKGLLQTAAVIGMVIPVPLLQAVTDLAAAELRTHLGRLQAAEFLYETGRLPASAYTFKHALTHEVAYGSLLQERRCAMHGLAAQAIEGLFAERLPEHYYALAHHYSRSGDIPKAVDYLQRAGRQAVERSAYAEAVSHLTAALDLLTALPETRERAQLELGVQMTLGIALRATKGQTAPEVERLYTRARQLCERVGEPSQLFRVLWGFCHVHTLRGAYQTRRALAEQLLGLAQRLQDPDLSLEAHHTLWTTLLSGGELGAARPHLEQGMKLYDPQRHRTHAALYSGHDSGVCCRMQAAHLLWLLGYPDQALASIQAALALARQLAHPLSLCMALRWAAVLHYLRREAPLTQARAEAAVTIATDHGFSEQIALVMPLRDWALAATGEGEERVAPSLRGLAAYQATEVTRDRSDGLTLLAETFAQVGQISNGLEALAEGLATVARNRIRWWEAELYRLRGELLLRQTVAQPEEAEACFQQALAVARRQQAKSWELRAAMSLARLWQQQGHRTEAHELLAPVYGWFTEGFDTADLREAKALLDALA
jgi:predicted ATPase/DNA-binding winged helix-turn-helix (wHTH) protein/class 3 adenylate cyclase